MSVANVDIMRMDESCLRALRDMSGQIAHDLNNMLTPLVAYPEMIREGVAPGSEADSNLAAMETAVSAIKEFCDRLMLFSGRSAGQRALLDIHRVVAGAVDSFRMEAGNPGITVEHRAGEGAGAAVAVETAIETAVRELCRNAGAAMPEGGRIVVTSDFILEKEERRSVCGGRVKAGLYARITVSDSGRGIPPELRWSALNPFVTGTGAAGKRRGAGMGLSLVCAIARDHGGHVDMECGRDSGTTVAISIPVAPDRGAFQ